MVFSGIYPEDPDDYEELEKSLNKLRLTDASIEFNYESSASLGSGFRCGFLGMLHMDVFRQRLTDEYDIDAIITAPSITYYYKNINSTEKIKINNPVEIERPELIKEWYEPICTTSIITPVEYVKLIKSLCNERRAIPETEEYLSEGKVVSLTYVIPLSELVSDFFDRLKSLS